MVPSILVAGSVPDRAGRVVPSRNGGNPTSLRIFNEPSAMIPCHFRAAS